VWYAFITLIYSTAFTNFNSCLGSLNLDELERIVIDGSHIDQKQRGIFDMKETHFPLLQLLTRPELRDRLGASKKKVQILMF
jgi:protein CMS1